MDKYLTINSCLRKSDNNPNFSIPRMKINSFYNITTYNNKIYPNRNYNKMENKLINTELSSKFNNYMLLYKKPSQNNYLFKTIWTEASSSLHNTNKKTIYFKGTKPKLTNKTNEPKKISLKLLNDFFNPETTKSHKSISTPKKPKKPKIYINYPSETKKEMSPNNYLYYYFPNLFNVPNNRIVGPKNLNSSKFFASPLPTLSFNEEVKNLKVPQIRNNKNNENGKSICSYLDTKDKEKEDEKQKNNPIFLEKLYSIDVLKNIRFGFKNSVERGKFNNLIKSFYTARNLKYILPKSK